MYLVIRIDYFDCVFDEYHFDSLEEATAFAQDSLVAWNIKQAQVYSLVNEYKKD